MLSEELEIDSAERPLGDNVEHTPRTVPTWGQGNGVSAHPSPSILGRGLLPGALTSALFVLPDPRQKIAGFFTANTVL